LIAQTGLVLVHGHTLPRLKQNCSMVVMLFKNHVAKVNNNLMIKSLK